MRKKHPLLSEFSRGAAFCTSRIFNLYLLFTTFYDCFHSNLGVGAMQAGVYVAIGYAVTQAIKRSWESAASSDDSGVSSYRLNKQSEDEKRQEQAPRGKRLRRHSEPTPLANSKIGEDEELQTAEEEQLQQIWAGPLPPQLEDLLDMMHYPDVLEESGGRMPKGIILNGPPGTGKTWFAKCLAQLSKASFFYASASQFDEIYVGRGPQRIRALFAEAAAANRVAAQRLQAAAAPAPEPPWWRRVLFGRGDPPATAAAASSTGTSGLDSDGSLPISIIFIDELDALGTRTGLVNGDARHATLSELLTQMDGMNSDTFGTILVVAATNNLSLIDGALQRSGRFDQIIQMPLPDAQSREAIIKHYLNEKLLSQLLDDASLFQMLAAATEGFNCADLKNMANECSLSVTRAVMAAHKQNERRRRTAGAATPVLRTAAPPVGVSHLLDAFESVYAKVKRERPDGELLSRRQVNSILAPLQKAPAAVPEVADPD